MASFSSAINTGISGPVIIAGDHLSLELKRPDSTPSFIQLALVNKYSLVSRARTLREIMSFHPPEK